MNVGMRVIYDNDGEIVAILSEMIGDVMARKQDVTLHYIDIKYGSIDFQKNEIVGVDVESRELILQSLPWAETSEQARIRELENLLLTNADLNHGGIL